MQTAKDRQEAEMATMQKEISTLTRALTTLTHKIVDKSSRCGGSGGQENDRGYETEEREKENTPPRTRNKQKHDAIDADKKKSGSEKLNTGGWTFTPQMKWDHEWEPDKKRWFIIAQCKARLALKTTNPKLWKQIEKKRLLKQLNDLES